MIKESSFVFEDPCKNCPWPNEARYFPGYYNELNIHNNIECKNKCKSTEEALYKVREAYFHLKERYKHLALCLEDDWK